MKVSVVVATYGGEEWKELAVARALPSVYGQDPHETRLHHHYDGTLAEARNQGAETATGDWLCFLDADDELAPGYLDAMRHAWVKCVGPGQTVLTISGPRPTRQAALASPTLLVPAVQYVDPLGYESDPRVLNDGRPLCDINRAVIGTLVPRELFLRVGGFSDEWPLYEDWATWLACERAGARLVDVPDAIYRAHTRPRSRNLASSRVAGDTYRRIREQHLASAVS